MSLNIKKNLVARLGAAGLMLGLAGCGLDDVQMNGKIFDALGVNSVSEAKKTPQMAARSPLVVPPGLDRLPEPGTGGSAPALADIQDPDEKKKVSRAELERQQEEYCKVHYEDAKVRGDQDAVLAEGPLGPCHNSIFSAAKNLMKGDEDQ